MPAAVPGRRGRRGEVVIEPTGLRALLREIGEQERHAPRDDVVRLAVRMRARDACEYCLLPTNAHFHVEPIVPPLVWDDYRAGALESLPPDDLPPGPDHIANFAWVCPFCDLARAQRATVPTPDGARRLFDPRRDRWAAHFLLLADQPFICGHTPMGRASEAALAFNDTRPDGPVAARLAAMAAGLYPPRWARPWSISAAERSD